MHFFWGQRSVGEKGASRWSWFKQSEYFKRAKLKYVGCFNSQCKHIHKYRFAFRGDRVCSSEARPRSVRRSTVRSVRIPSRLGAPSRFSFAVLVFRCSIVHSTVWSSAAISVYLLLFFILFLFYIIFNKIQKQIRIASSTLWESKGVYFQARALQVCQEIYCLIFKILPY